MSLGFNRKWFIDILGGKKGPYVRVTVYKPGPRKGMWEIGTDIYLSDPQFLHKLTGHLHSLTPDIVRALV
jgi:hypothetical protein